jgi:hypothetical protein
LVDLNGGLEIARAVRDFQPRVRVVFMSGGEDLPAGLPGAFVKRPVDFQVVEGLLAGRFGPSPRRFASP